MKKVINYELKKVQITCPNCKYEFPYNKQALEKRINQIGGDINKLNKRIKIVKKIPPEQLNLDELKRLENEKDYMINILNDYKLQRETLKESEDRNVFENLKMALREIGGDEMYKLCMDRALRDSKAYRLEEMMSVKNNTHNEGGSLQKITK